METVNRFKRFLFLLSLLVLLLVLVVPSGVLAQTAEDIEPVNLSRSGGELIPFAVVDSGGITHVVWEDEMLGTIYTREEGNDWRNPAPVTVPFAAEQPLLRADEQGWIHAFWRNEDFELFYSRVTAVNFAEAEAWTVPQQLAASALALDVVVAENGRLHLTYVRQLETEEAPAGIYYRQSGSESEGRSDWSVAQLLAQSAYFRTASPRNSHVAIARSELLGRLYVAWDNRAIDQTFVIRSDNNGQSWQTPVEVDRREPTDTADAVGPSNIRVATQGSAVHLIWQAGHGGLNCALYHQRSGDGGQTWDQRQPMWDQCFQTIRFLGTHDGLLFLLLIREGGAYLVVWDGERWSEPQRQPTATQFLNPDTFRSVSLGCHQATLRNGRLVLLGCGQSANTDVWFLAQQVGDVADWFPPPSIWRSPEQVMVQERQLETAVKPILLPTDQGELHLFWHWPQGSTIHYSTWDGTRWLLQPATILTSPDGGRLNMDVLRFADRFGAVWSDSLADTLYFSQVGVTQAALSSAWFDITMPPLPHEIARTPSALYMPDGRLLVAYTVPINEDRGIYLISSADRGATWSEPVQVFDGAAAGWPLVGAPTLTQTEAGDLHIMWRQDGLLETDASRRLVYAYATDAGESWSAPETVVAETAVSNPFIIGVGESAIHRLWQTHNDDRVSLWHQFSDDNGRSWSQAAAVGGTASSGPFTLVTDPAGAVHLLRVVDLVLEHWLWQGGQWIGQEGVRLWSDESGATTIRGLAATVSVQRGLVVGYVLAERPENNPPRTSIQVTSRLLPDVDFEAAPEAVVPLLPSPTPDVESIASPTPLPSPTPPLAINDLDANGGPVSNNDSVTGIIVGVLTAVLVVGIAFVLGLRAVRS